MPGNLMPVAGLIWPFESTERFRTGFPSNGFT
jgi:hypothetical protein